MRRVIFLIFLISHILAYAKTNNLKDWLSERPCANELIQESSLPKSEQFYSFSISRSGLPLLYGMKFQNFSQNRIHKVWSETDFLKYLVEDKDNQDETLTTWQISKACKKTVANISLKRMLQSKIIGAQSEALFTDESLKKLIRLNSRGIIYVWSPYMPLSVRGISQIKKAAAKKKYALTILLDRDASMNEAKKWVKMGKVHKSDLYRDASDALDDRDVSLHYPFVLMYQKGFVSNHPYVGYKSQSVYERWLDIESAEKRENQ